MMRNIAVFLSLLLCLHGPAMAEQTEAQGGSAGQAAHQQPEENRTADKPKAPAKKPKMSALKSRRAPAEIKEQPSDFVRLGQLILDNRFAFNSLNEMGLNAFDPAIGDRILVTPATRWAFGQIETGDLRATPPPDSEPTRTAISRPPQSADPEALNPFFGAAFQPAKRNRFFANLGDSVAFSGLAAHDAALHPATNGSASEPGETDFSVGANRSPFAYRYNVDKESSVNAGFHWIRDLGDTTGLKAVEEQGNEGLSPGKLSGMNLSLGASYKAVTLTGGYIRALDTRTSTELALEGKESDPVAWNSELAYSTELLRRETTLAVGYQKSSDALQEYLPEERYSTRASMALSGSTTFSLEYYQDRELTTRNGEADGYGITTRIGFDF